MTVGEITEDWLDICGYEGVYKVSNLGNVKSKEKVLSVFKDCLGYHKVRLYKDGKSKQFYVNKLVADCYIDNPFGSSRTTHKDGNLKNNCAYNLEWQKKVTKNYGEKIKRGNKTQLTNIIDGSVIEFESNQKANDFLGRNITYIFVAIRENRKILTGIDGNKYTYKVERSN